MIQKIISFFKRKTSKNVDIFDMIKYNPINKFLNRNYFWKQNY